MDKRIIIYHGSEKIVEQPIFGGGKKNNDFGHGFYCTANEELAKEWAVSHLRDGFSNKYTLNTEYLNILFEGAEAVEKDKYHVLCKNRDDDANRLYLAMLEEESDGLYIQDLMRGGIQNDDPRIPRNVPEWGADKIR